MSSSSMGGGKVCGEVRLRMSEFWDLPVEVGRDCFYTVECGNDCFYRSACFQTEQLKDYESPVSVARTAHKEETEVSASASTSIDWRDKQGTVRFFLRGRVCQGVRLQVWQLAKDVMAWRSDNSYNGVLERDEMIRGIPLGSVRLCQLSFPADSLRLSKGEYAGWLALYPQGCVYMRLLQRRKVGIVELLRLNLLGETSTSRVKMNSTRSADCQQGTETLAGRESPARSGSHMLFSHVSSPDTSPWRDVIATGYTADSVDHLIEVITRLDSELAKGFTEHLLQGFLPSSLSRIMGMAIFVGAVVVLRDSTLFTPVVFGVNAFLVFILSLAAFFSSNKKSTGSGLDCGFATQTGSGVIEETLLYGELLAARRKSRAFSRALAETGTSGRGALTVSWLMVIAVILQSLLDATRFIRNFPRSSGWRSMATLIIMWSLPWTLPKLWRVAVRGMFVLVVLGVLTRHAQINRVLANMLGTVLVISGIQRQSVMAPLYWVTRNIPKGWSRLGRSSSMEEQSSEEDLIDDT